MSLKERILDRTRREQEPAAAGSCCGPVQLIEDDEVADDRSA